MKKLLFLILLLAGCATTNQTSPPIQSPTNLEGTVTPKGIIFKDISTPQYGIDPLILGKQDCAMILSEVDAGTAVGVLDQYADPRPCINDGINQGKWTTVRVHLIDGTVNNHQCSSGETISNVIAGAKKWAQFSAEHLSTKFYISPFLEWGCSNHALLEKAFQALGQYFPSATPVCSSIVGGCPGGAVKLEGHGNVGHADIRSNDGASLFDADSVAYRNSGSTLVLGWTNCMNGRTTSEHPGDVIPPPLARKNWCTRAEVRQVVRIMREPQTKPTITGCKDISSNQISKTNAEYYGVGKDDGRGNKGLLILQGKYPRISIRTLGGKEVGFFKYYGPYTDGRQRHYIGKIGSNETPVQLMDELGGEWGKVIAGNSCLIYNSIRRLGSFH